MFKAQGYKFVRCFHRDEIKGEHDRLKPTGGNRFFGNIQLMTGDTDMSHYSLSLSFFYHGHHSVGFENFIEALEITDSVELVKVDIIDAQSL